MSKIFQPLTRNSLGALPTIDGVGPIVGGIPFQGMVINTLGAIHTHHQGTIDHYANGLPFDVDGRLVVGFNPVVRVTQAIPYNQNDELVVGDVRDHIDQSLAHEADASLTALGILPPLPPEDCFWDLLAAQWDECLWGDPPLECEWDDVDARWGDCLWGIP